jgi:DNA gyrase subunit A
MGGEHKLKEGDRISQEIETSNGKELIFFTNKQQAYKCKVNDFADTKASVFGDFLPQKLGMDEGEAPIYVVIPEKNDTNIIFIFENGKMAKVPTSSYETKSNRRRLTNAYSDKAPIVAIFHAITDIEVALYSGQRMLLVNTAMVQPKPTRNTQGVSVMSLKKNNKLEKACLLSDSGVTNPPRYRTRNLPAAGALLKEEDLPDKQLSLL